jgi:hypothetical protein
VNEAHLSREERRDKAKQGKGEKKRGVGMARASSQLPGVSLPQSQFMSWKVECGGKLIANPRWAGFERCVYACE